MAEVHAAAGSDDAVVHAQAVEAAAGLIHQLLAVHEDADAIAELGGPLSDVAEDDRLPTASRQNVEDAPSAPHEGESEAVYPVVLILPEFYFHLPESL